VLGRSNSRFLSAGAGHGEDLTVEFPPEVALDVRVVGDPSEDALPAVGLCLTDHDGVGVLGGDFLRDRLLDEKTRPDEIAGVRQAADDALGGMFEVLTVTLPFSWYGVTCNATRLASDSRAFSCGPESSFRALREGNSESGPRPGPSRGSSCRAFSTFLF
jgi:hypothetical protein